MDWQIEAQVLGITDDEAVEASRDFSEAIAKLVDDDDDRYYVALIARPGVEEGEDAGNEDEDAVGA